MPPAIQNRALRKLLLSFGVKEPEAEHVQLLRKLLYSQNPSASGVFPGSIVIGREYGRLVRLDEDADLPPYALPNPGVLEIPELGVRVICGGEGVPVFVRGALTLRSRRSGDAIRLSCGTKSLKKLFIDEKIPACRRNRIPVIADEAGVVMIPELNLHRHWEDAPNCRIRIETL